ncbi:MAG: transporter, family, oxalate/formate antiporter [Alphaproteobacteria bacterium]|nr:transporter, family, oxalate/formate antiporter [Alphaproteobacteria bacterium]
MLILGPRTPLTVAHGAVHRKCSRRPHCLLFGFRVSHACCYLGQGSGACVLAAGKPGDAMSVSIAPTQSAVLTNRWIQLLLGLIAMMAISSPQYVWTLFTGPLTQKLGTTLPQLQVTFSLLIVLQTFFSPFQAYLVDRFGPKLLIAVGAIMSGGSWLLAAHADSLMMLYITYGVIGGFGTGIIYVGIIGLMVRWFPDRRGLATGIAAAGYGFGAFFTSFPIDSMIKSSGYEHTLVVWGVIQGVIGVAAALGLRTPPDNYRPEGYDPATVQLEMQSRRSFTPKEMLTNPIFYLLFIMMAMMSTSGLMVVSNVGPFANEFKVAGVLVLGMAALPLSLTLSRVTNGLTRPFFGWVSDHIGRENTMALAFSLEAVAILVLFAFIDNPAMFVVLTGLVFFGWGEIFSLFPSTLTDTFGPKFAATNYGFLYIAQGVGSILGGPAAAFLKQSTGSWTTVFVLVACLDALTALLAITVLKKMRRRHFEATN